MHFCRGRISLRVGRYTNRLRDMNGMTFFDYATKYQIEMPENQGETERTVEHGLLYQNPKLPQKASSFLRIDNGTAQAQNHSGKQKRCFLKGRHKNGNRKGWFLTR